MAEPIKHIDKSKKICKNCIHYELCKYNTYQRARYLEKDKEIYITIDHHIACKFFTDGIIIPLADKEQIKSALEKQISKTVKYLNRHGSGSDLYNKDYFNCPSCGRRLRNKQKDNYCGRCGQRLDWSDTE